MKKILYSIALMIATTLVLSPDLIAQNIGISIDRDDMRVSSYKSPGLKGSPYLYENWAKGTVQLTNGIVYEGMDLLYDQIRDELIFTVDGNQRQIFMQPVQSFTISNPENRRVVDQKTFTKGFTAVDGATPNAFYEVLAAGNTQLLKRTTKAIVEERSETSILKVKQIKESIKYYVARDGQLTRITPSKKSVLTALSNKKTELEGFIKQHNLNLKEEADLAELVDFYNSL
ncbi:hypothetical protein [uncultured Pontibacter sp.]|uniref:hypothetical protein n=1 Tax=uncultured Pontibacter sp. TaxID=453356 RepID=UPI00260BB1BB|nr:hypothetical protein [uncultured Pontibacter sp.]